MDLKTLDKKYIVSPHDIYLPVDPKEFRPTSEIKPSVGLERIIGYRDFIPPFMEALASRRNDDNVLIISPHGTGKSLFAELCIQDYIRRTTTDNIDQIARYNFGNPNQVIMARVSPGVARKLMADLECMVSDIQKTLGAYDTVRKFKEESLNSARKKMAELKKEGKEISPELQKEYDMFNKPKEESPRAKSLRSSIAQEFAGEISSIEASVAGELAGQGYTLVRDDLTFVDDPIMRVSHQLHKDGKMVNKDKEPGLYLQFREYVSDLQSKYKERSKEADKTSFINREVDRLKFKYRNEVETLAMLEEFSRHMLSKPDVFAPKMSILGEMQAKASELNWYTINILQDNAERPHEIPYEEIDGAMLTEFRGSEELYGWGKKEHEKLIAGAFVRASGPEGGKKGIVYVKNGDMLMTSPAFTQLAFMALKKGKVKPVSLHGNLQPEEALANVRVVMSLGNPYSEHYLNHPANSHLDSVFKRVIMLPGYMDNTPENRQEMARHFRDEIDANGLRHATPEAIAKAIEVQMSKMGKRHLDLKLDDMTDLYARANYRAEQEGSDVIDARHVEKALIDRSNERDSYERQVRESFKHHRDFPTQPEVGAIGGLFYLGSLQPFGRPFRLKVQAVKNKGGLKLYDIETSSGMAGEMAKKTMMQIEGLLRSRYETKETPLDYDLYCSYVEEYHPHDGPSAGTANTVAAVSALGNIPLYPNVFFTGAISPNGDALVIGGLNEKVAGVIETAQVKGMSETVVAFPQGNRDSLQLVFKEHRDAVESGQVRLYSYRNLDEALEIAAREDAKAVDAKVKARLKDEKAKMPNMADLIGGMLKGLLGPSSK